MARLLASALLLTVLLPAVAAAQNPALAGTWTLDGPEPAGRGGIPGVPIATEIVVTLTPAQVTVDTNTGSARSVQSAVYKLDGSQNPVPGPLGWDVKARAAWEGPKLVVTTRRSLDGPNGPVGVDIIDAYTVAADTLTIERTQGRNTQKLTYTRKK
jgi:hypothetical protein